MIPQIRAIFTRKRKQDEWMNNNAGRSAGAAGGAATYNSHELSSDRPSPCRSKDIISQSSDSSLTLNTNMPIPRSILSSTIKQSLSKYGRRAGGGKDGNSTRVEIGNSTDRIVDVENGNPMVIHQRVEYFVNGRAASPRELEEVRFDAKRAAR